LFSSFFEVGENKLKNFYTAFRSTAQKQSCENTLYNSDLLFCFQAHLTSSAVVINCGIWSSLWRSHTGIQRGMSFYYTRQVGNVMCRVWTSNRDSLVYDLNFLSYLLRRG